VTDDQMHSGQGWTAASSLMLEASGSRFKALHFKA